MSRSALVALLAITALGCGGGNVASKLVRAPDFNPKGQTKCGVSASQSRPLIVEWPSADRGALEAQMRKGIVVVRYAGCEMEVLRQCQAGGGYNYAPVTLKEDHIRIRDVDELYANIPVYAAKFEGKLETAGELNVDMTVVGSYEASKSPVRMGDLEGDCSRATHYLTAITAGAFEFASGASATVGGGAGVGDIEVGGESNAEREVLNRDGSSAACKGASRDDENPPDGCGALLRVEAARIALAEGTWSAVSVSTPPAGWGPNPFADAPTSLPRQAGSRQRRVGTTALWTGGVFAVLGAAAAGGALAIDADLDEACGDAPCHPSDSGAVSGFEFLAMAANVGLIGGGALLGLGLTLHLTAPDEAQPKTAPTVDYDDEPPEVSLTPAGVKVRF
jgi:hypothetical protein